MTTRPVVGIAGAGQLARMTAQAAVSLDVAVRLLADAPEAPAAAATPLVDGAPIDLAGLRALAARSDVVTFDHEGVEPDDVAELEAAGYPVHPSSGALRFVVDKAVQRRRLAAAGFPFPPFAVVDDRAGIEAFAADHGSAMVAKSARGGYDGRGVWFVDGVDAAAEALAASRGGLILEPRLPLDQELAVLVARRPSGAAAVYPVVETVQRDGICTEVVAPAPVPAALAARAHEIALGIAGHIGATGILAVELFVVDGEVLVNELAARPHNSGHLTIEGAVTSQFENHVRAVLDWPLGRTDLVAPAVAMVNVLAAGPEVDLHGNLPGTLEVAGAHVHLYGKRPRAGRKVGHVTVTGDDPADVLARARGAAARLAGGVLEAR